MKCGAAEMGRQVPVAFTTTPIVAIDKESQIMISDKWCTVY